MKFTLPKDAFPAVNLSRELREQFSNEADTIVREMVVANEAFISHGSKLEYPHWKLVRAKDGIQVFRQRKKSINQRDNGCWNPVIQSPSFSQDHTFLRYDTASDRQMSSCSSSGIGEDTIMERMRPRGVALMALHGTMDGTLDDCMLGCFAPTNAAWMLRSSHIYDHLDDARFLATVRGPTRQDPCRFLGVKWFAKEHPAVFTGIVQQRDFLIIEASGFTRDSKGERVGYFLMHSVTLREIPELTHLGMVRGLLSFCYLFRQSGPGKVDVFCRGFFDSRGAVPGRLSVSLAAESAICCANVVDYAYIKKLRWLVNNSRKQNQRDLSDESRCEVCDKSLAKHLWPTSGTGTTCQICHLVVCSKCSVAKKITMDVSETGVVQQRSLRFCLSCLMNAKQQSGWDMALSNLEASSRSTASSVSSSASGGLHPVSQKVSYRRDGRFDYDTED
ncbi:hypothetical protein DD238_001866 [Peronospora effusa]|uniref:FYVE-type domain-containing protein n=2 Tax=Peronospora effusa TaxID=542832 RepID=A0A3M6VUH1_9STRA|nr:hypothetical protein DD238_001866 [Peronospora effusa]